MNLEYKLGDDRCDEKMTARHEAASDAVLRRDDVLAEEVAVARPVGGRK